MSFSHLFEVLEAHWQLGEAVGGALFIGGILGSIIAYHQDPQQHGQRSLRGYFRYLLPAKVFFHRSSIQDYLFAIIHKLTYPFLIGPALIGGAWLSHQTMELVERLFGPAAHHGASWGGSLVFTVVVLVLANDFWFFWFHRLEHRVWWLWEFHKAHHAAEAMAWGMTARRNHPVDEIVHTFGAAVIPGIGFGLFAYLFSADIDEVLVYGISIWSILEVLGFRHLKHSHIHLKFPLWLEYFFVSPAMHQLHHSREERHWDRNFSTMIALWDVMYRSWHPSEPERNFRLGLANDEAPLFNRTIFHVYFYSFYTLWREIKRRRAARGLPSPEELVLGPVTVPQPVIAERTGQGVAIAKLG